MTEQEKCSQCLDFFSLSNHPRLMPSCRHSICDTCLREAMQSKQDMISCGFCDGVILKKDIRLFTKNARILKKLKQDSLNVSIQQQEKEQSRVEESEQLLDGEMLLSSEPAIHHISKESFGELFCQMHEKPLDIVCISDKKRICAHCAIFGTHKDHRLKTIKEFKDEIDEKIEVFHNILTKKQNSQVFNDNNKFGCALKSKIEDRKGQLTKQIKEKYSSLRKVLMESQKEALKSVDENLMQLHNNSTDIPEKARFLNWETKCARIIHNLEAEKKDNLKSKIQHFYGSELELSSQGYSFLKEAELALNNGRNSLQTDLQNVKLHFSPNIDQDLAKYCCVSSHSQMLEVFHYLSQFEKESNHMLTKDDENSFIFLDDFSLSRITRNGPEHSEFDESKALKKVKSKNLNESQINNNFLLPSYTPPDNSVICSNKILPEKETKEEKMLARCKSNPRNFKSPTRMVNASRVRDPDAVLLEFIRNDLTDSLDLSDFQLADEQLLDYVQKARAVRRIKGLKLSKNHLTNSGLEKLIEFLQGTSNLNLAGNDLTEAALQVVIKNRDKLLSLRIVNVSNNKVVIREKKVKTKMDQFKKMGIIVTL